MAIKPQTREGYTPGQAGLVRCVCLTVATKIGDLADEVVIVGGLVPSLLITPRADLEEHVGTLDLDVGLSVALLDSRRYQELSERLRGAGFKPAINSKGNPSRQTWTKEGLGRVTIDFLIVPSLPEDVGGTLRDIEPDFAAFIAPGLDLAFRDKEIIRLTGQTLDGADATRDIQVCGPGAFLVLKALAFANRSEPKDAYDLDYLLRNYGDESVRPAAIRLKALLADENAAKAVEVLRRDFNGSRSLGVDAVARFLVNPDDDNLRQDVHGGIRELLRILDAK